MAQLCILEEPPWPSSWGCLQRVGAILLLLHSPALFKKSASVHVRSWLYHPPCLIGANSRHVSTQARSRTQSNRVNALHSTNPHYPPISPYPLEIVLLQLDRFFILKWYVSCDDMIIFSEWHDRFHLIHITLKCETDLCFISVVWPPYAPVPSQCQANSTNSTNSIWLKNLFATNLSTDTYHTDEGNLCFSHFKFACVMTLINYFFPRKKILTWT